MRQEGTTTRDGKYRSANCAVRDGDSASDSLPRVETGSDRNEDLQMGMGLPLIDNVRNDNII